MVRLGTTGHKNAWHNSTVHQNTAQLILLKLLILSTHPISQKDAFPLPNTGISSGRALDTPSKTQGCH